MHFIKVLALRGPNVWANFPVLEAWVDLQDLKETSSEMIPGFNERLTSWLPTMVEHRCSVGERGGFFQRLERGTYLAHILEHVTLELQTLSGDDVGFGRARETSTDGIYRVAIEYHEEKFARACLEAGRELSLAAVHDRPFDVAGTVERLRALNENLRLGPSTGAIVAAAKARGIPVRRLNEGSLVQFGYGAKQRRILAAETDRTGAVAQEIAQDKELTRSLLRSIGVPVPEGRAVSSADDAWEAAEDIGLPVVVKPQFGNQGRGVATNLQTREQVYAGYAVAREQGASIVVEKFIPGGDYRLLVAGHRVVAAARREPAQIMGDGVHSIAQLVEIANRDPRRGEDHATPLNKIPLDSVSLQVLAEQSLGPASVPPAGTRVLIRRNANLSTGGTAEDISELVHPEVAARAVEAARMVGLDIAGVDVVTLDISRPIEEQGGAIVEVNAAPGLRMHVYPSSGTPQPVGEAIVSMMFPEGQNGRIPVVGVTGTNGKTTTTRFIAHLLSEAGHRVGMTCTDGVFVDGRRIDGGDCSGPQSARSVLMNPFVEAAVLETARGGILREGLGFDRCDVAVVTNIGDGDHLGIADIDTPEQLANVKRTLVDAVAKTGAAVLNASDPLVAAMAEHCPGKTIFFSLDPDHATITAHRAAGGRAVIVRSGTLLLAEGDCEIPLCPLVRVPITHGGRIGFQVENTLATAAAAWALGLSRENIRAGLESFAADMEQVPGRFNLLEIGGATVIVDYGHNASALSALIGAIAMFPHEHRTVVYTAAGDRRDSDMIEQGRQLGMAFDRVMLYEDHYLRGRKPGEIMGLFRQGLADGTRVREVMEIAGAVPAVEAALRQLRAGELLVIQADVIDETVEFVRKYLSSEAEGREIDLNRALGKTTAPVRLSTSSAMATQSVD